MSRLRILLLVLHVYVGARLLPDLPGGIAALVAGALVLAGSAALVPFAFRYRRARAVGVRRVLMWGGLVAMGAFSSLVVLTMLRDAALLVLMTIEAVLHPGIPIAAVAAWSAAAVPALTLVATLVGYANARGPARVRDVEVPIASLPSQLAGFTIAQITDVHVGPTIERRHVEALVATVNELDADLVAITGDLVDGSVAELAHHTAPLARLAARHGTFFVTGNHEYYSGVGPWIGELRRLGITVLVNEHVALEHQGATLVVAGVTDVSAHHFVPAHRSDPQRALAGAPRDAAVRLLLAHQPRSAHAAERAGFHLQLSGHTHGGQFLPWNLFVRLQQPFTAGLARLGALWVYTSRGTGYWGPPKRLGAPSEITRLRLVPA